jgi:ribosomal protein S18 acetylase RimI-like enzyme
MGTIDVRFLTEEDWRDYRAIRLRSLAESPAAFATSHAEEAARPDSSWREQMNRADRLLAFRDGEPRGVVSLHHEDPGDSTGEVRGLWVVPEARNTGIAWALMDAAVSRATDLGLSSVSYWVSTENGRALAFATNYGFRPTSARRTVEASSEKFGDQEVALVMTLSPDLTSAPNPTAPHLTSRPGPR